MDKLRVALLRFRALGSTDEEIVSRPDMEAQALLRQLGFSKKMLDGFFRAFYGGIFLERELRTSSRMFEFTFKMFSQGSATLPARGMGAIPLQLAKRLPPQTIRINSPSPLPTELPSSSRTARKSLVAGSSSPPTPHKPQ